MLRQYCTFHMFPCSNRNCVYIWIEAKSKKCRFSIATLMDLSSKIPNPVVSRDILQGFPESFLHYHWSPKVGPMVYLHSPSTLSHWPRGFQWHGQSNRSECETWKDGVGISEITEMNMGKDTWEVSEIMESSILAMPKNIWYKYKLKEMTSHQSWSHFLQSNEWKSIQISNTIHFTYTNFISKTSPTGKPQTKDHPFLVGLSLFSGANL